MAPAAYPESAAGRDAWILKKRGAKNALDPFRAYAAFVEEELSEKGELVPVATILLTNRECPWRCLMCDLWRNTLDAPVPAGAIPTQIAEALAGLGPAREIKLYNAGSFFDPGAIPREDYEAIANLLRPFERVVVESHPALIGSECLRFQDQLSGQLEVAMGLETVEPGILAKLNKRMTLELFQQAAAFLSSHRIGLRAFVLIKPPFTPSDEEAVEWAVRSASFGYRAGAGVVSLIPTRAGNGALDSLASTGQFSPPGLGTIEQATAEVLRLNLGRVFVDLWDLEKFSTCSRCFSARRARLEQMNWSQRIIPQVRCPYCSGHVSESD